MMASVWRSSNGWRVAPYRRTSKSWTVDTLLVVAEPYFKSMETAARCKPLAEDLSIPRIVAVANKIRGPQDEDAMRQFFARAALPRWSASSLLMR